MKNQMPPGMVPPNEERATTPARCEDREQRSTPHCPKPVPLSADLQTRVFQCIYNTYFFYFLCHFQLMSVFVLISSVYNFYHISPGIACFGAKKKRGGGLHPESAVCLLCDFGNLLNLSEPYCLLCNILLLN